MSADSHLPVGWCLKCLHSCFQFGRAPWRPATWLTAWKEPESNSWKASNSLEEQRSRAGRREVRIVRWSTGRRCQVSIHCCSTWIKYWLKQNSWIIALNGCVVLQMNSTACVYQHSARSVCVEAFSSRRKHTFAVLFLQVLIKKTNLKLLALQPTVTTARTTSSYLKTVQVQRLITAADYTQLGLSFTPLPDCIYVQLLHLHEQFKFL